ncbi:MAG TPA: MFS transporter [Bryobacteraceae bacterium]|nr:MFS transporter [Bryobacteraceae bacterium]
MLILAAILAIFIYGMIAAMLGTILPGLSERFHLTPSQNGTIAFGQALGLMIASVGVGPLIDNEGKKVGLVLGLVLIAVALASLPRARGFGGIVAFLFVLGLGGGIVVTGANALVSDVAEAHRGTALNLVNLFFGLGGMATPFISANLLKRDTVKLCYAAGAFAVVALIFQLVAPIPGPTGVQSFVLSEAGSVLGRPILLLLGLSLFLYVSCEVGIWNWLVQHLIAQGIPENRALNVLSLGFALGMLVGRMAVSPVLISVPAVSVTLAASIAMALTTWLALRARGVTGAWILVFLAGVAMAPVFPTTLAIVGDAFPRMTGTAIGFAITCGWAGLAVSSRLIGAIAGGDPKRLRRALLVIPAFSVIMIGLNLAIRSFL